jgi:phage gp29-like protein
MSMLARLKSVFTQADKAALSEPQTARLSNRQREFAGHPSRGLTPAKLASILEAAEQGDIVRQHELFLDMEEKDAHLYAEMAKRKRAILTVPWTIAPPRNASAAEKTQAAELEELLRDIPNFEDVLLDMMDGVGHGFSNLEIEWQRIGKDWVPKAITHRPQTWFQLDFDTRTELRLRDDSANGSQLQPFGWISHIHRAKSGYIARAGLCRVLSWPYLFKNYSVRDLAEFLEIYGLPLRVGKYPSGASDKEKSTLLAAVVGLGHNAAGIMPDSMAVEIQEAAKGSEGPFLSMTQWAESSISKAVLGGTLTSQADGKSSTNALGNVHNEVRHDILEADARQVASTLTSTLLHYLVTLNKGGAADGRRMPRFEFDTSEPEDLALFADALPKLAAVGAQIPVAWVSERLKFPMPKDGEAVLGVIPANAGIQPEPASKTAVNRAKLTATDPEDETPIDPLTDAMSTQAAPALENLIEQVRAMVNQADSLESLRDALLAGFGQLDSAELARVMALGFSVADLAGRFDVETESGG